MADEVVVDVRCGDGIGDLLDLRRGARPLRASAGTVLTAPRVFVSSGPTVLFMRKPGMEESRNRTIYRLEHEDLTGGIIGAAIRVHTTLGPGFIESVYQNALELELEKRDIRFQRQLTVPILYEGFQVGAHRLDLFVADEIVVELKAVVELLDVHFATVRSYLRAIDRRHGLILNFAKPVLEPKRVRNA